MVSAAGYIEGIVNPLLRNQTFNEAEAAEIELFRARVDAENREHSAAFERDVQARRAQFEQDLVTEKSQFISEQDAHGEGQIRDFMLRIAQDGAEATRASEIPPYSFVNFPNLPIELQTKVWEWASLMAAGIAEPHSAIFSFAPMGMDTMWHKVDPDFYIIKGSSRVNVEGKPGLFGGPEGGAHRAYPNLWQLYPGIFTACKASHAATLSIYTQLPSMDSRGERPASRRYLNTRHSVFYIGGSRWDGFKLLVDLIIRRNTTRPLHRAVSTDLDQLLKIRNLHVDFCIFADVPVGLWAEFYNLDVLTIVFDPYSHVGDAGLWGDNRDDPKFKTPRKGTKMGKRADWILDAASKALSVVKQRVPDWPVPKLEAVILLNHWRGIEAELDEEWDGGIGEMLYQENIGDGMASTQMVSNQHPMDDSSSDDSRPSTPVPADDSVWYAQAAERMSREITTKQIKKLKRTYHCSRLKEGSTTSYVTDSEGEEGKAEAYENREGVLHIDETDSEYESET